MKSLIFIIVFTLFARCSFAQTGASIDLAAYLKSKKLIALTDTTNLPKAVMENYQTITGYLLLHFKKFDDYYAGRVLENGNSLHIDLYALSGIILEKQTREREIRENEAIKNKMDTIIINGKKEVAKMQIIDSVTGNLSGKDGVLILDKASGQIKFMIWQ